MTTEDQPTGEDQNTGDIESALPGGWTVWSATDAGRIVLVFRPDIFDSSSYPAACLPTIYITKGCRSRRRPGVEAETASDWHVTLTLEPEVTGVEQSYSGREEAIAGAVSIATEFVAGDFALRDWYQVPREGYLTKLEELTGM